MTFSGRGVAVLVALPLLLAGEMAEAGNLKISPLRAVLSSGSASAQFVLRNDSDSKSAVQVEAAAWSMDEKGGDVYGPAPDLVFFPRILELDPGGEGVIRVGWNGKGGVVSEQAYRLFARELPEGGTKEAGVRLTLTLSVPIFVQPDKPGFAARIESAALDGGRTFVLVRNEGNVHLRVEKILCVGRDAGGGEVFRIETPGWYVLAGAARSFSLDVPAESCASAARIEVEAVWEGGRARGGADVASGGCAPSPALVPR